VGIHEEKHLKNHKLKSAAEGIGTGGIQTTKISTREAATPINDNAMIFLRP
jgi:hypothetical protein